MKYSVGMMAKAGIRTVEVLDARGGNIANVESYDSGTGEVTIMVRLITRGDKAGLQVAQHLDGRPATAVVCLPGSRIRLNGMEEKDFWKTEGFGWHEKRCGAV